VEQALRDREEELQLILNSTAEGIFGLDREGRCTFANRASVVLLGYEDERQLRGQDMHALVHHSRVDGTPYPREECRIHQVWREGKATHVDDDVFWRADGSHFPTEYLSYPMRRDGQIIGTVVNFTDITERQEKEAQLRQAQKMEVVGQLTGGIAHDFNNLLTVILGNLRLLEAMIGPDQEAQELVEDALSAARDGAELTQRLLAFSRKQTLQPKQVNINALLDDLGRFLHRTLREDVELRITRGRDTPAVLADPGQLENALLNLVINARDAMPRGGTLSIEATQKHIGPAGIAAHPKLAPGNYVMLSVADTGIGMSPEDTARAVEPFFTTKGRGKGSGLGLSMVYGFAQQSGGSLWLCSELGKGTRVSVLLPEAEPVLKQGAPEHSPQDVPMGTETILVVEDQSQVRKFAERSLKGLGYRVLEAENAAAAMQILDTEPTVDVLFSDIIMPGAMNGRQLAQWAVQDRPGVRVLLTTGFSQEGDIEHTEEEDDDFPLLKKPYTRERLAEAIREILDVHDSPQR
jgi:two-component system cell cycle sensor histidine kinase/response regulator CckA